MDTKECTGPTAMALLGLWLVIHGSAAAELSSITATSRPADSEASSHSANNSVHQQQVEFISQYLLNNNGNSSTDNNLTNQNNASMPLNTNRENRTSSNIQPIPVPAAVSSVIDTLPVHPRIPRKSPERRKTRRRLNKHRLIPGKPVRFLLPPLENKVQADTTSGTTTTEPPSSSETIVIITSPSPGRKTSTTTEAVSGRLVVEKEENEPSQNVSPQYRKVFIPPPLRYLLPPLFYENYINAQPSTTLSPPFADDSVKQSSAFDENINSDKLHINANFSNHNSVESSSISPIIVSENWNHKNIVKLENSSLSSTDYALNLPNKDTETVNIPSDSYPVQSTTAVLEFSQPTTPSQYGEYISKPVKHFSSQATVPNHSNQQDFSTMGPESRSKNYNTKFQSSVENHYNYPPRLEISISSTTLTSLLDTYPNQNNKTSIENYPTVSTISITSSTLLPHSFPNIDSEFNHSFENISEMSAVLSSSYTLNDNKTQENPLSENYPTLMVPSSTLSPPLNHYKTHEMLEIYPRLPLNYSTLSPPSDYYKTHDNQSFEVDFRIPVPSSTLSPPFNNYKTHENQSFEKYSRIPVPSSTLSPPLYNYKTRENQLFENHPRIPVPSSTLSPPLYNYKTRENPSTENYPTIPIPSSTLSPPLDHYKTQDNWTMDFYKTNENTSIEIIQQISVPSSTLSPPLNSYTNDQNLSHNYPKISIPSTTLSPPTHSFPVLKGPNIEQALFETGEFGFDLPKKDAMESIMSKNDTMESTMSMMNRPLLSPEVAEAGMKIMVTMKMDEIKKEKLSRGKLKYNHLNQFNFQNGLEDTSRSKESSKSKSSQLAVAETSYYDGRKFKQHIEEIDVKAIPGRPGKDYPTLSKPPDDSDFSCRSVGYHRGYVADHDTRCQLFYICVGDGPGEPMLCPNGTVFSQDFLVCDWWFNVDCKQQT